MNEVDKMAPGGLLAGKRGAIFGVANDRSIAWACAKACAAHGASLALGYQGGPVLKRVKPLADGIPGTLLLPCDVTSDEEIAAFFARIGREWGALDFLIHSVAFADREDLRGRLIKTSRGNFAKALDISAYSLVAIAREAEPLFTRGGSIIAMTYYGAEKVVPGYNVMGVAKAALESGARYLAADLGPRNVRVNCISAGPIKTLSARAIEGLGTMLGVAEQCAPLRRNVETDEVAATAVYLLSDMASAITGEVVHVDCGYHVLGMYGKDPSDMMPGL